MNAMLLFVGVTLVTMLWLVLAAPAVIAQSRSGTETFQEQSQTQQVAPSAQERLKRQWQRTIEKAFAQHAMLEAWQQRVRFKQASVLADPPPEATGQFRATRGGNEGTLRPARMKRVKETDRL